MENNLVSIVMATYNGEKYLREQLDSIIEQTYKNIELIVVDDCSQDSTLDILVAYQASHNFIKIYRNESNMGVSQTFSFGITKAIGDYVAFCDQDDVWLPNKIERMVAEIGDNLLIHGDAKLVDQDLNTIEDSFARKYKDINKSKFTDYLLGNNVTGCCTMISRELVQLSMPIPENFYIHDHYFALVASYYKRIKFLDEKLVLYRQHGNNVMGAAKVSYDKFLASSLKVGNSFDCFILPQYDLYRTEIKLIKEFRISIYSGRWIGQSSIFGMLKFSGGWKYILYFYFITGFGNKRLGNLLYNLMNGIK